MNESPSRKRRSGLTGEAFDALLSRLDTDRERAGEEYETLRRRLIRFFDARYCTRSEDYSDEVINRLAKKLHEGTAIQEISSYSLGVARILFKEIQRELEMSTAEFDHLPSATVSFKSEDPHDLRLECFESCLGKLTEENRTLIVNYYQEEKKAKIDNRKQLASRMGIPLNALRIKTCRIRERLEACVNDCVNS